MMSAAGGIMRVEMIQFSICLLYREGKRDSA